MKNDVRFEYVQWKNVWLCFISIVLVRFNHKTKEFWLWKPMKYFNLFFNKKIYYIRFKYIPWKNVWFCIISIVLIHFSHKIEKFRFLKSLKYFNFFWEKKWCQIWICPIKQFLIWFKLRCLSRILEISWEIRTLNFIKAVQYFSITVPGISNLFIKSMKVKGRQCPDYISINQMKASLMQSVYFVIERSIATHQN